MIDVYSVQGYCTNHIPSLALFILDFVMKKLSVNIVGANVSTFADTKYEPTMIK